MILTELNRDNLEKNQAQENTVEDLEAQTDDKLQTIRELNEENKTAKAQNRELHDENRKNPMEKSVHIGLRAIRKQRWRHQCWRNKHI